MPDSPFVPASVPVADPAEQVTRLQAEVDLAYRFETAARRECEALDARVAELTAEVHALRARVEPLERIARLANGLTIDLLDWRLDPTRPVGNMVRAIQSAIRELRPPTVPLASRPPCGGSGAEESRESEDVGS